ncbi:putative alpha beta hydrolase protein [Phaeoacremonium minimum UCRPA7]|uniref:Putative alpha beta hydrolase protein n=1 Tax=Phaeoacremonium minimum (strain UCR-PA7) TaxID=1286976 RepID=R8BBL3_PHAM7|nr:putative alpha beta hydrolase protein [Phaeoacremonium minimum UCRPA7]EON96728.1 putative alpha beta hydrolase protein [Phaeoacremonium minimum UCRPA7]
MQPKPGLSLDQFHEWYNNEHGPTRVRIPQIFSNGLRFRATDAIEPTFLAVYDVTSMSHLETPTYLTLRANRSSREAETIGEVDVNRYFYDLQSTRESPDWVPIEQLTDEEAEGIVLVAVEMTLTAVEGAEQGYISWLEEEHIPMLSKVPGWLRARRFRTSSLDKDAPLKYLVLYEYAKANGLGGPEYKAATSTPWREQVFAKFVADKGRRTYNPFYVFGPAPRDLSSLSRLPSSAAFTSADGLTSTTPGSWPVISSYITTADGLSIPYRLEGNSSPNAPTLAFCNSLLTSLHMWDPLVDILKSARPEFRILRYDTRGRHAIPSPPVAANLDMLSDDLATLLSALRIQKLHALIGVSMGGATTLKFALKYPGKLGRFVACDFNAASSEANTRAWKERITVAETPVDGTPGIQKLAKQTVERWFHPGTVTSKQDVTSWMTEMVGANDIEGFRYSCQALWDYNMKETIGECQIPGLLVVGEGDGKGALVKAMDGFKGGIGATGVQLKVVPEAGHLPMCENPQEFWDAVNPFL